MIGSLLARLKQSLKPQTTDAPARLGGLLAPGHGMPLAVASAGWWREDATEQIRQYQSWVYAAVHAIGQEVAKQRPMVYRNTGQAEHEQLPLPHTHPLCRLLEQPNPWLTPWELWYLTVVNLELTGNCFWHVAYDARGQPAELWILPTPWVTILPDATRFVRGYEVRANGVQSVYFEPHEIIQVKYPHPLDPYYGLSPLQANAVTIDANQELLQSRYRTFQSGQRPGVLLHTDQTLNEQTVRRLEEKLEARFAGKQNWHRPMVLEQGLKASPWTLTPAEMDYLNSARLTRDEILAIYRVPAPVTGLVENLGLGADIWNGARAMFCEGTIQPKLDLLGQILTRGLAQRYHVDCAIAFPDCSPRTQAERRKEDEIDAKLGLRTINEIRQSRGLAPFPDPRFDRPTILPRGIGI